MVADGVTPNPHPHFILPVASSSERKSEDDLEWRRPGGVWDGGAAHEFAHQRAMFTQVWVCHRRAASWRCLNPDPSQNLMMRYLAMSARHWQALASTWSPTCRGAWQIWCGSQGWLASSSGSWRRLPRDGVDSSFRSSPLADSVRQPR
jgi:hypothetical protein